MGAMDPAAYMGANSDFFSQFGGGVTGYGAPGTPPPQVQGAPASTGSAAPPQTATAGQGSPAPQITNPQDPGQITAWLQWRATQPNSDPILQTPGGIQYYLGVIQQNGGLTDTNYWTQKSTLASAGGAVGAGGGNVGNAGGGVDNVGPGGWTSGYGTPFTPPTEAQLQQMPGFQFALDTGVKALDQSAAAKGTVLNGGQQKDILGYATGLAEQYAQQGYENALNTYMTNYNVWNNDTNNIWNRQSGLANAGSSAATSATA